MTSRRVFHRERAAGVCAELQAFLDWWEGNGPFPLVIPQTGGVRYDEGVQMALYRAGSTRARTLADTPHGRGGAVDAYPCIVGSAGQVLALRDKDLDAFQLYGELAEKHGLEWGGRWPHFQDRPHIQRPNWRELPYPPPKTGGVA